MILESFLFSKQKIPRDTLPKWPSVFHAKIVGRAQRYGIRAPDWVNASSDVSAVRLSAGISWHRPMAMQLGLAM